MLARDFVHVPQHGAAVRAGHGCGPGRRLFVAPVVSFGDFVGHTLIDGVPDGAECRARAFQRPAAAAVGKNAEVADAMLSLGQDVKQEASDELVDGDGGGTVAGLSLPRPGRLPMPE